MPPKSLTLDVAAVMRADAAYLAPETPAEIARGAGLVIAGAVVPPTLFASLLAAHVHPVAAAGTALIALGQLAHARASGRVQRRHRELLFALRRQWYLQSDEQAADAFACHVGAVQRVFRVHVFLETRFLPGSLFGSAAVVVIDGLFRWDPPMSMVVVVTGIWGVVSVTASQVVVRRLANMLARDDSTRAL